MATRIDGQTRGPVRLNADSDLYGQIIGDVFVPRGIQFICQGQIVGNLIVENGGIASVPGMVVGTIQNDGGSVEVSGMYKDIVDLSSNKTRIHPGALRF